jgi:hypothetical protein
VGQHDREKAVPSSGIGVEPMMEDGYRRVDVATVEQADTANRRHFHDLAGFSAAQQFGLRQPAVSAGVDPAQHIGSGEVAVRGRSSRLMTRFLREIDGALERDLPFLVTGGTGTYERRAKRKMRGGGQSCVLGDVCLLTRGPQHLYRRAHRARGDLRLSCFEQRSNSGRGGRAVNLGRFRFGREEYCGLRVAPELAVEQPHGRFQLPARCQRVTAHRVRANEQLLVRVRQGVQCDKRLACLTPSSRLPTLSALSVASCSTASVSAVNRRRSPISHVSKAAQSGNCMPSSSSARRGLHRATRPLLPMTRVWTGPNDGAVNVANTHGCAASDSGIPLPPASPARMSW